MAAAALPLALVYLLETDGEERMQTLNQWTAAVWLASTCRELRKESKAKRELAALQWVYSSRFAIHSVIRTVKHLHHPLDDAIFSRRVAVAYGLLTELGDLMAFEDEACAFLDEKGALARIRSLLPFLLRARDRLRWVAATLDDEFASYYRRWRLVPRRSPNNLPGKVTLALEDFEFDMCWRRDRPFRDAHFRPL